MSLYQNQMVRKTTEKEEEGQIDTKGKKNTVTVAKTKLSSVQAKVSLGSKYNFKWHFGSNFSRECAKFLKDGEVFF